VARGLDLLDPGPATAAHPNTQDPVPGAESAGAATEGEELVPVIAVDAETRRTHTTFRDRRGGGS
jgi:hypothetical protein